MRGKTIHFVYILLILIFGIVSQGSIGNITPHAVPTDITLGGLFPLTGALAGGGVEREAAFRMAIEKINADPTILPDTVLNFLVRDTATDPTTGATMAQELLDLGVFGLVGAASSGVSMAVAQLAETAKKPQISYSSTNGLLSNKTAYPYFLRVVPPDSMQGVALAHILFDLNVRNVATLSPDDDYGRSGIASFNQSFLAQGGSIEISQEFVSGSSDVTPQLQAIKDSTATVIVANMIVGDAQTVFTQAASLGITKAKGYQWVGTDGLTQSQVYDGNDLIRGAMEGMIGTGLNFGEGPLYESFLDLWESCNGQTPAVYAGCGDRIPNAYAPYAYDAVYAFALAADALIKAGDAPNNGSLLLQELKITQFNGVTGIVSFDENHDRNGIYNLLNHDGTLLVDVGNWGLISGLILTGTLHVALPLYQVPIELLLGGLFPLTGSLSGGGVEREAAFRMAIEQINTDATILPGTILNYIVRDTATDVFVGANAAQELLDLGVFGLVGAASSAVSMAVAEKAEIAQKPQISYSSTNPGLSDKISFPYFLRVVPPDSMQGLALAHILIELNVSIVATLSTTNDYGTVGINVFTQSFTDLGGTIMSSQQFSSGTADVTTQLQAIKDSTATVIVANMFVGDARTVFAQAASLGLTIENGYQWFGNDGLTQPAVYEGDALIRDAMEGLIGLNHNIGEGPAFEAFLDLWESCNGQTMSEYAGCGDRDPNLFATFAYDAVFAFALAADTLIKSEADPNNGSLLLEELKITHFDGVTGKVSFDENQDRNGVYNLLNHDGNNFVNVGRWDLASGLSLTHTLHWVDTYIPVVTIADTHTSNVITFTTISEKPSEDTSSVVLPYNIFWGIIGWMVIFRFNILDRKKKSKN